MSVGSGRGDSVPTDSDEPSGSVHVRRLGVADTLRWSWAALRERPEFIGLTFLSGLPAIAATAGITEQAGSELPEYASWVWVAYLVQLLVLAVTLGAVSLSAADTVAYRSRRLKPLVRAAARRLPSLLITTVVVGLAVGLSLLPSFILDGSTPLEVLVVLFALLFVGYVFVRLLLSFPACVIDGLGPVASVREGWAAGTGIVRKVFAIVVLYVLGVVISTIISAQFGGEFDAVSTLPRVAINSILIPFFGFALTHLYLEGSRNR